MKRRTIWTWVTSLTVACLLPADALVGQEAGGESPAAQAEDDTLELIFEREVFEYPSYERRNPFRSLSDEDGAGPRFEDLVLLGVVVSADPSNSMALLGARTVGGSSTSSISRTFRVRAGQTLGNNRILDIRSQQVLVEVEDFGVSEIRTLELRRVLPQTQPQQQPQGQPQPQPQGQPQPPQQPQGQPQPQPQGQPQQPTPSTPSVENPLPPQVPDGQVPIGRSPAAPDLDTVFERFREEMSSGVMPTEYGRNRIGGWS